MPWLVHGVVHLICCIDPHGRLDSSSLVPRQVVARVLGCTDQYRSNIQIGHKDGQRQMINPNLYARG